MIIDEDNISILITGDFCPQKKIEKFCREKKYSDIFGDTTEIIKESDISITNLECPLTNKNKKIRKAGPYLKSNPLCIDAIKYAGFNVVTLSNNHILDYGMDGMYDTIKICHENNIKTIGVGRNLKEASEPLYINIKNTVIAFLNFAEGEFSVARENYGGANPLDVTENFYQIKECKKKSDVQIVIIHGGNEHYSFPSPRITKIFRFFADLGVTAVIGHHPHCTSGYEIYHGVPIFYSLGNFIFETEAKRSDIWHEGFFVKIILKNKKIKNYVIYPYIQGKEKIIKLMNNIEKKIFFEKLDTINNIINNNNLLKKEWIGFCANKKNIYLSYLYSFQRFFKYLLKCKKIKNIFMNRKKKQLLFNLFYCDSHRDVMINILDEKEK